MQPISFNFCNGLIHPFLYSRTSSDDRYLAMINDRRFVNSSRELSRGWLSRHLSAGVSEEITGRLERLVRCILTELTNNYARTLVLVRHHRPLRGGTSAPQNLQDTTWLLLLAGTTWSLLQTGHVRLSCKTALIIAMNGFISSSLFPLDYVINSSPRWSFPVVQG